MGQQALHKVQSGRPSSSAPEPEELEEREDVLGGVDDGCSGHGPAVGALQGAAALGHGRRPVADGVRLVKHNPATERERTFAIM